MTLLSTHNTRAANPKTIGERLKLFRSQANMSQYDVAVAMNLSNSTKTNMWNAIYRLERGDHQQRVDLLAGYCSAVGRSLDELFAR
jgi:transcriptional regulator with XRE-family HTH domain